MTEALRALVWVHHRGRGTSLSFHRRPLVVSRQLTHMLVVRHWWRIATRAAAGRWCTASAALNGVWIQIGVGASNLPARAPHPLCVDVVWQTARPRGSAGCSMAWGNQPARCGSNGLGVTNDTLANDPRGWRQILGYRSLAAQAQACTGHMCSRCPSRSAEPPPTRGASS
jgi:hypothetical protein